MCILNEDTSNNFLFSNISTTEDSGQRQWYIKYFDESIKCCRRKCTRRTGHERGKQSLLGSDGEPYQLKICLEDTTRRGMRHFRNQFIANCSPTKKQWKCTLLKPLLVMTGVSKYDAWTMFMGQKEEDKHPPRGSTWDRNLTEYNVLKQFA
jgi:hypothetical protein